MYDKKLIQEFPLTCYKCGAVYNIIHIFDSRGAQNTRKVEFYCNNDGNFMGSIVVAGLVKKQLKIFRNL